MLKTIVVKGLRKRYGEKIVVSSIFENVLKKFKHKHQISGAGFKIVLQENINSSVSIWVTLINLQTSKYQLSYIFSM